jgi:putative CocE/NonD family hydrolase
MLANHNGIQHLFVTMSDGVALSTYVCLPAGEGNWPVIFGRTPYSGMLPAWREEAAYWSGNGYAFVFQACRGTGGSEGEWKPFVHEKQDGLDSLNWIIEQAWSNGNIATYGASYSGVVQWAMCAGLPPEVKTMFIAFTGIERYRQNYMGGMFRHDIYTVWALGNAGVPAIASMEFGKLYKEALSVRPHVEMDVTLFGTTLPWYRDWVANVDGNNDYWTTGLWEELRSMPEKARIPILMTSGWFDHNLEATIISFHKLPESIRKQSALAIGPWIHSQRTAGDLDYPNHNRYGENQIKLALQWFDHHLKGRPQRISGHSVTAYAIGEEEWRVWSGWIPQNGQQTFYLTDVDGEKQTGGLQEECPAIASSVAYIYDPDHPVPTRGGAALMAYLTGMPDAARPASVLQDAPGTREDVRSFESAVLDEALRISGSIRAVLSVSTDVEDTAFTVCVMEVMSDGRAYNIRDGISSLRYRNEQLGFASYAPGEIVSLEIELWPILWTIRKGSKIRVDVSSSNFPAYHAHSNCAGVWAYQKEVKLAKQSLHLGGEHASWIELPILG